MTRIDLAVTAADAAAAQVAEVLTHPGAVVLVPTETVYGLTARFDDAAARRKIFQLKNRPEAKRLGWFIGDWRRLRDYGVVLDGLPERLAAAFTPGALTIIAPCRDGGTQGFRVPDHPLLTALLRRVGEPLVQTSANASGMPDALGCDAALEQLRGEVDCVVDGGVLPPGACGSTVVDACGDRVRILRRGAVDLQNWS